MKIELAGRRAIVTGSTDGIGFAAALAIAKAGGSVVINGRNAETVEEAGERIRRAVDGAIVDCVPGDVSTPDGAEKFIKDAGEAHILINNVGRFQYMPFDSTPDSEWMDIFNDNVLSGVRLARHYLPEMISCDWGRIIFISSESALNIGVDFIPYCVTKVAQLAVMRGLAQKTSGTGVTVNAVLAGPTRNRALSVLVKDKAAELGITEAEFEQKFMEGSRPTSLLKRLERPEEVANLVTYLASDLSSGTNGSGMRVDGGIVQSY